MSDLKVNDNTVNSFTLPTDYQKTGADESPSTTGNPKTAGNPATTDDNRVTTLSLDLQSYDGLDTILSTFFTNQDFNASGFYDASSQQPNLPEPNTDQQQLAKPYSKHEQTLVKQAFSDQVQTALQNENLSPTEKETVFVAVMTNGQVEDPRLNNLAKFIKAKTTAAVQKDARLPTSWTMQSQTAKDWIATPLKPYSENQQGEVNQFYDDNLNQLTDELIEQSDPPLTDEQVADLKTAVATGQVSSDVADLYVGLTKAATQLTQVAFGLPISWFKGTEVSDDWKPVNIGIITPATVNSARLKGISNNLLEVLLNLEKSTTTTANNLAATGNTSSSGALLAFLQVIGEAIQDLKQMLRQISTKDAEQEKDQTQAKFDELHQRRGTIEAQEATNKKMVAKQKKMAKISKLMKIFGPIISAITTILAAILTVVTFGAALPLVVATVTLGIAMTAYSVADSVSGITQKMITAVTNGIDKMFPNASAAKKLALKILVASAVMVVMAVILVASIVTGNEGVVANVATQTVSQVARQAALTTVRQAISLTVKQLMVQGLVMTLLSSNIIPEAMGAIFSKLFKSEKDKQIFEAVIMVVTMIVAVAAAGAALKPGNVANDVANNVANETEAASNIAQEATNTFAKIQEKIASLPAAIKDGIKDFIEDGTTNYVKAIKEMANNDNKALAATKITVTVLDVANPIAQAGVNISNGVNTLIVAKYLKDIGDAKSSEELIMMMIQMLEKIVQNMQSGISQYADFITQLQGDFNQIYNSAGSSGSRLAKSILA
jgi:invasin B